MKIKHKKTNLIIPMNAMSDVAFLLLIFIMVVSLINYQRTIAIEYPKVVETSEDVKAERNLSVWIDKNGNLFLDGESAEMSAVEKTLSEIYVAYPETRIHIIADKNTEFKNVSAVIELLQALQYSEVSFVVKDEH
ncbi:MAG: biopolymer transporter ExbD [Termitinemataceae bacterium]|nr:MAG: biopolymer transporter ExbD [Termitinemataceae bacterium]